MRVLCGIRTNVWNENTERLCQQLLPHFGGRLVVVFHNRTRGWAPPIHLADINLRWVTHVGLAAPGDWGWRCGDYFYYRMRQNWPNFDQYWLLEPDVFFAGDPGEFFAKFEDQPADMLTYEMITCHPNSVRFARKMPDIPLRRAIFALTRFSGRAIDYLFEQRKAYSKVVEPGRMYANDEIFSMSHVCANKDLTHAAIEAIAPEWFERGFFNTAPDILADELRARGDLAPALFHPVHEKPQFSDAIVKRLIGTSGFLGRMSMSTRHFNDAEVDHILTEVAAGIRQHFQTPAPQLEGDLSAEDEDA